MWPLYVSALVLVFSPSTTAVPGSSQPKVLRRLTPGANVISLSRTNSMTDLKTGRFDQKFCEGHMVYLQQKQYANAMAYYRNTGQIHSDLNVTVRQLHETHDRLFRRQNGTSKLTVIGQDLLWSGPVQVGTPPQTFNVDFDTGSSDFFLASENCPKCTGKTRYIPSKSSTSKKSPPNNFKAGFGDGSSIVAEGVRDTVSVGQRPIPNVALGAVTVLSDAFTSAGGDTSDGLMGLAFPTLAQSNASPYFSRLTEENSTLGLMSFKFVGRNAPGSELTVGGMDKAAFKEPMIFLPVATRLGQQPTFWTVAMGPVSVNGNAVATNASFATIDTGTTNVLAPEADVKAIYAAIPGSVRDGMMYQYPCNLKPKVALSFGGQTFEMDPADMSLGTTDATGVVCVGAISIGPDRNAWLVGDSFLKNVYTVFDQTNRTVGFAKLATDRSGRLFASASSSTPGVLFYTRELFATVVLATCLYTTFGL